MTAPDDIRERMAVIEARVAEFGDEMRRTRDRLHDVENDRHAVGLLSLKVDRLTQDVVEVGEKVDKVAESMEGVAQRAAREAVRLAFNEWEHARADSRLKVWGNYIAFAVAFLALVGVVIQAVTAAGT